MISIAALRALVAGGASAASIVDAVEAQQAEDGKVEAARRAKNAERMRVVRERARTCMHTPSLSPSPPSSSPPYPPNNNPLTPIPTPSDPCGSGAGAPLDARKRASRDNGHRLPDDWQPSLPDQAVAGNLFGDGRFGSERLQLELEKFRDHWRQQPGSRGVKLDWDAAWRNWLRRAAEYQPHGANNGRRRTVHDAARDLHESLLTRVNIFDQPVPECLRGGAGADVVRLLPAGRRE